MYAVHDPSHCPYQSPYTAPIAYTWTTLFSSPATLVLADLNGAILMMTMGDNETTRTDATSPETFVIGVSSSHFTLSTMGISQMSISFPEPGGPDCHAVFCVTPKFRCNFMPDVPLTPVESRYVATTHTCTPS